MLCRYYLEQQRKFLVLQFVNYIVLIEIAQIFLECFHSKKDQKWYFRIWSSVNETKFSILGIYPTRKSNTPIASESPLILIKRFLDSSPYIFPSSLQIRIKSGTRVIHSICSCKKKSELIIVNFQSGRLGRGKNSWMLWFFWLCNNNDLLVVIL